MIDRGRPSTTTYRHLMLSRLAHVPRTHHRGSRYTPDGTNPTRTVESAECWWRYRSRYRGVVGHGARFLYIQTYIPFNRISTVPGLDRQAGSLTPRPRPLSDAHSPFVCFTSGTLGRHSHPQDEPGRMYVCMYKNRAPCPTTPRYLLRYLHQRAADSIVRVGFVPTGV